MLLLWPISSFLLDVTKPGFQERWVPPALVSQKEGLQGLVLWRTVPTGRGWAVRFGMLRAPRISCALCYHCISSTSDHQALDSGVWGPAVSLRCMTSETQVPNLNDHQSHLWSINIAVSGALRDIPGWIPGICTFEQPLQWVLMVTVGACSPNYTHYTKGT